MGIGDRIKTYEKVYDSAIIGRVPVIIRLDGKGFSKWTKRVKAQKPFDQNMNMAMRRATEYTMGNIEGCMFGYTQSDETTLILRNDQSLDSTPWFANRIQKIVSTSASFMTAAFNKVAGDLFTQPPLAHFDARVFAVPNTQEAVNCLVWRQQDATKNSISASCYYELANKTGRKTASKMMHGLNQNQQQELLFKETGINWNDYTTVFKRGLGVYRKKFMVKIDDNMCIRSQIYTDKELPIFAKDQKFLIDILEGSDNDLAAV